MLRRSPRNKQRTPEDDTSRETLAHSQRPSTQAPPASATATENTLAPTHGTQPSPQQPDDVGKVASDMSPIITYFSSEPSPASIESYENAIQMKQRESNVLETTAEQILPEIAHEITLDFHNDTASDDDVLDLGEPAQIVPMDAQPDKRNDKAPAKRGKIAPSLSQIFDSMIFCPLIDRHTN
jgi:hypothetical protein